jgi:hypothetical protein
MPGKKIMNKILILILVLFLSFFSSCKKDQGPKISEMDYLIFGHFYGMCQGDACVETFKLTDQKLYEDETDRYYGPYAFSFKELDNAEFELVKDLVDYFPPELLNETDSTFGCPDCADQGGLLVMISQNGNLKTWRIDQSKAAVPQYLHAFMDSVNVCIGLLSNE